jgi:Zn-dependent protease
MNGLLFWIVLLVGFYLAYRMGARGAAAKAAAERNDPPYPDPAAAAIEARLEPVLAVTGRRVRGGALQFEGRPRAGPEETARRLREIFAGEPVTPVLLEGEEDHVRVMLLALPEPGPRRDRPRWGLHWLLFAATVATTTWAGALDAGVNLLREPGRFAVGLPYSLGLLLILGAHELGHYFTAKGYGIRVTPPYFIPVPFALGTFGAFIKIKSLTPDRRALFDVAVAGPLAGVVFAIPALLVGLRHSVVIAGPSGMGGAGVDLGSSLLLALLAKASLGASALAGNRLLLDPLAFAGWLGLIVTALNLLPIGQLDGGHVAHALLGSRRARAVSLVALVLLFLLALFVWPGLMFWAFVVLFIAGTRDMPAADDVSGVGRGRQALGAAMFVLLLLIIVPVPHSLWEAIGIHGPYL